jgi:1-acyl-sn-glycerol-3-phosphate acyltransferase
MPALRSLAFLLFQAVVTIAFAAAMLLCSWLPRVPLYRIAAAWCRTNLLGARWICGIRHRAIGTGNVPATPHIVMSKHSSTWETLALTLFFPPLAYVAKKELLSIPFFGWGFALASPITIDRKSGTDAMHQIAAQGRERFRQGFWIVIYPEGTRIRAGTRAKYKTGGARLAIELGVPILPVAHNAGYLWPKGVFGKRPGIVTISIGPPIAPDAKDAQTLTRELETWIETEVARLGVPDGHAPRGTRA